MDHADAEVLCGSRRRDVDLLAADPNGAGVAPVDPGKDLHQRRLAGAVLADEGVDLAGPQVEPRAVERVDTRERLADPLHLDEHIARRGLRCHARFAAPPAGADGLDDDGAGLGWARCWREVGLACDR